MRIALDAMGGDYGVSIVVPAAMYMLEKHSNLEIILVGDKEIIHQQLRIHRASLSDRVTIHHTTQQVAMDESPALALRNKKNSSMRVAIDLVKSAHAQACVSAGNTGALMATARFVLKMLPGVDRPAIMARIPTHTTKPVRILDLGANVDVKPEHLLQFAVMGAVVTAATAHTTLPSIALLNIGHEDIKGNELVKQTHTLLQQRPDLNYVGYIEANEIFSGKVDVVVCDGFVGNIALKTSEGTARLMAHFLKTAFKRNWLTRIAGLCALPILNSLRRQMDPARYNGASLLGLQGIVIKSHGGTSMLGFARAIEEAMLEIQHNVPQKIHDQVAKLLTSPAASEL